MEIGNLWLIPLSIIGNCSLYWVLKHYLVKWFCRSFLSESVQLECDLKKKKKQTKNEHENGMVVANGYKASNKGKYGGKKLVTDGDVNGVSMEMVGSMIAAITAFVSFIVLIQTRRDIMNARSSVLIPWTHIAAWYFIVDLYNMFDAFRTRNPVLHLPKYRQILKYIRVKWPYIVHHVFLFIFGYSLVVNDHLRNYKGDFIVAVIIGEDFSNPLVNMAKMLKLLGQERTKFYLVNGYLLVVAFFVVRILNIPFVILVYAAQYHNWSIMEALYHLKISCYVFIILQYCLQIYWFTLILKLALRSLSERSKKPEASVIPNSVKKIQ